MTCERIARLLKAIAEPTRLRIVCLLERQERLCVCELTEILELPQYHVSRHLAVLRNLGIVIDVRDGARVNYSLSDENEIVNEVIDVLSPAILSCPRAALDQKRAAKVLKTVSRMR